jgi:hypothetical protein
LVPQLEKQFTTPTGYNPTDVNNMLVAGEQGAGGATGSIVGQANLEAARTRNTGALSGVLDQAARQKQQVLSQNALNVANKQAEQKEKQRQLAAAGLESMYGKDVGAQLEAMKLVPADIGAETEAGKSGWQQNAMNWIKTLRGGGGGGGGAEA